jgi:hypothetical protein
MQFAGFGVGYYDRAWLADKMGAMGEAMAYAGKSSLLDPSKKSLMDYIVHEQRYVRIKGNLWRGVPIEDNDTNNKLLHPIEDEFSMATTNSEIIEPAYEP